MLPSLVRVSEISAESGERDSGQRLRLLQLNLPELSVKILPSEVQVPQSQGFVVQVLDNAGLVLEWMFRPGLLHPDTVQQREPTSTGGWLESGHLAVNLAMLLKWVAAD